VYKFTKIKQEKKMAISKGPKITNDNLTLMIDIANERCLDIENNRLISLAKGRKIMSLNGDISISNIFLNLRNSTDQILGVVDFNQNTTIAIQFKTKEAFNKIDIDIQDLETINIDNIESEDKNTLTLRWVVSEESISMDTFINGDKISESIIQVSDFKLYNDSGLVIKGGDLGPVGVSSQIGYIYVYQRALTDGEIKELYTSLRRL
jgi:hypothetical protein